MNWPISLVFIFTLFSVAFAEARRCDSKDTEFLQSRPELSCMACEMEFSDIDSQKAKMSESRMSDSQIKSLAGPSDRYWALMSVAVRQLYSKGGVMSEDEFKLALIRVVSAAGPCRDLYFNPDNDFEQLRNKEIIERSEDSRSPRAEKAPKKGLRDDYAFPDLGPETRDVSDFAARRDSEDFDLTWISANPKGESKEAGKYRSETRPWVATALGFKDYDSFASLMGKPKLFDFMSHDQLRSALKTQLDTVPGSKNIYSDKIQGKYLRSCVAQLKTNLSSINVYGPKAGDVCVRMTRACFKDNTETWVAKVCSDHGLTSSGGSAGGSGSVGGSASGGDSETKGSTKTKEPVKKSGAH